MRARWMSIAVLFCLVFTGASSLAAATGPRVAVINYENVFHEALLVQSIYARLQEEVDAMDARLQELVAERMEMIETLEALVPNSREHAEMRDRIDFQELWIENRQERMTEAVRERENRLLREIARHFRARMQIFAEENGYDFVLLAPNFGPTTEGESATQTMVNIRTQTLFYYDDALDVTDDFLAHVNAHFEEERERIQAEMAQAAEEAEAQQGGDDGGSGLNTGEFDD